MTGFAVLRRKAAIAGVAAVLAAGGFVLASSGGGGHTVVADFADAQFLQPGNEVHIDGVIAGTVKKMAVRHNTAVVTMDISRQFWPIHRDATARIRPVTLLGELYVDLNPGTPSSPVMAPGGTIPVSHTSSSTNLQSVLNAVNDPTATALAVVVSSLGQGMAGQGANAADAIRALAPALTDTNGLLRLLDSQNQLLTTMIDNLQPVTSALGAAHGANLDALVSNAKGLMSTTAQAQTALGSDLAQLPGALAAAQSAFGQLGGLAAQAAPALASITSLTSNLPAVSQELDGLASAATPAVSRLQPVVTDANSLVGQAAPVVSTLESAGPAGLADVNASIPLVDQTVTNINTVFDFISRWALTTQDYDNVSHWFRFAETVTGTEETSPYVKVGQGSGSPGGVIPPPSPSSQPGPSPLPSLPAMPKLGSPVPQNLGTLPTLPGASNPAAGSTSGAGSMSATGLTSGQEQSLLGYLLGGS